jgi:hypothetical protein
VEAVTCRFYILSFENVSLSFTFPRIKKEQFVRRPRRRIIYLIRVLKALERGWADSDQQNMQAESGIRTRQKYRHFNKRLETRSKVPIEDQKLLLHY